MHVRLSLYLQGVMCEGILSSVLLHADKIKYLCTRIYKAVFVQSREVHESFYCAESNQLNAL